MKAEFADDSKVRNFLGQIPLFSNLRDDSLLTLSRFGKISHFNKGEFIFFQSDPSDKFYIVQTGDISILLQSADGREMVINEIHSGDYFGELGLLTNKNRSTSAVARTDSKLLVFSGKAFLDIIDAEPLLARRVLESTANLLRNSSERESALAFLDAQARLARLLLQLDKQESEKGYVTISQGELAQRTGLTRQTVAKALGRWRRAGWLITGRGHILLLRQNKLSQIEKEWLIS
jgi:CRP/FNR family transcriptional regulator, cyclic AMP receptor protein